MNSSTSPNLSTKNRPAKSTLILSILLFTTTLILPLAGFGQVPNQQGTNQIIPVEKNNFQKALEEGRARFINGDGEKIQGWKPFERAMHEQSLHLDENGNMVNYASKNLQALPQARSIAANDNEWEFVGPFYHTTGVGRINHITFVDADTWLVAAAGGGLWKTDNAGTFLPGIEEQPWTCLTNDLPIQAVSGVTFNPQNPDEIYILTGDVYNSGVPSLGVFKSTNGGNTWSPTALSFGPDDLIHGQKLVAHPTDPLRMYACTDNGLYFTDDAWQTFSRNFTDEVFDLEFKPDDPNVIYFGTASDIYSTDANVSAVTDIGQGLMSQSMARTALAVTPAAPNKLFVLTSNENGSFRNLLSFDPIAQSSELIQGSDCQFTGNLFYYDSSNCEKGQGTYNLTLTVHPDSEFIMFIGAVALSQSVNGGASWGYIGDEVHADKHAFEINPFTNELVVGCDGGIWVYNFEQEVWYPRNFGLTITQYYHFDCQTIDGNVEKLAGGSQDNGTSIGVVSPVAWHESLTGSDGMNVHFTEENGVPICYTEAQQGVLYASAYVDGIGWATSNITVTNGEGAWDTPYERGDWPGTDIAVGYKDLFYRESLSSDWVRVYEGINTIREIGWGKDSRYLGFTTRGQNNFDYVLMSSQFIETFPSENTSSYNWTSWSEYEIDSEHLLSISDIVFADDSQGDSTMVITSDGYVDGGKVYMYQGDDVWANLSFNLPNVPMRTATTDEYGIYVGSDIGIFHLYYNDTEWTFINEDMPVVPITDIQIEDDNGEKKMYISTYGRGFWRSDPLPPNRRTLHYVDYEATGANDGSSWENAFISFPLADLAALSGDTIWIAEGTYFPTLSNINTALRADKFILHHSSLKIMGGFAGWESSPDERIPGSNETIFSGNYGDLNSNADNAYHLFSFTQPVNCLFDNITFADGNANGSSTGSYNVGGAFLINKLPLASFSTLSFRDCKFKDNVSASTGGAFHITDRAKNDSPIDFLNCSFENNSATSGGAFCIVTGNDTIANRGNSSLNFNGCNFIFNTASSNGGAIYNETVKGGNADYTLMNCIFESNTAGSKGGAIYNHAGTQNSNYNDPGTVAMGYQNCQFNNNTAAYGGAIVDLAGAGTYDHGTLGGNFSGCSFNGNTSTYLGGSIFADASNPETASNYSFDDCHFANETTGLEGGAIHFTTVNNDQLIFNMNLCSFDNCTANSLGGGLLIEASYSGTVILDIDSCTFNQNRSAKGAGLYLEGTDASINGNISNCLFTENHANGPSNGSYGGAVNHNGEGDFHISYQNCQFFGNHSNMRGGAAALGGNDTSFSNCEFEGNYSTNSAGAVYMNNFYSDEIHQLDFNSCSFNNNESIGSGGAIVVGSSNSVLLRMNMVQSTFTNNSGVHGGAVHVSGSSRVELSVVYSEFENNQTASGGDGGAINYTVPGKIEILNSNFDSNTASNRGGVLHCLSSNGILDVSIAGSTFSNNTSNLGGVIHTKNNNFSAINLDIDGSIFDSNTGNQGIGGIMIDSYDYTYVELTNSTFSNNESFFSTQSTGAVYMKTNLASDTSMMFISNCDFLNNHAVGAAGALHFVSGGSLRGIVNNSRFEGNSSNSHGGAIRGYTYANDFLDVKISNSFFLDNTALSRGGAILFETSTGTSESYLNVDQCVFAGNAANEGGAIHMYSSSSNTICNLDLRNSSLVNNFATTKCGGVSGNRTNGSISINAFNNVLWSNNDGDTELNERHLYKAGTVTFTANTCNVEDGLNAGIIDGGGNLNNFPHFVDALNIAGADNVLGTTDDGLQLQEISPCLDAANSSFFQWPNDIAGTSRPQNGGFDIGAYESYYLETVDCPGDLNGDFVVNTGDLNVLLSQFGCTSNCTADLTNDSVVNTADLNFLLAIYGSTCN